MLNFEKHISFFIFFCSHIFCFYYFLETNLISNLIKAVYDFICEYAGAFQN